MSSWALFSSDCGSPPAMAAWIAIESRSPTSSQPGNRGRKSGLATFMLPSVACSHSPLQMAFDAVARAGSSKMLVRLP